MTRSALFCLLCAFAAAQGRGPLEKPRTDWKREEAGPITGRAAAAKDRVVYRFGKKGLVCRSIEDGTQLWARQVEGDAQPVVQDDTVWLGLARFALSDGTPGRVEQVLGRVVGQTVFWKGHVLAASSGGRLYGIDQKTGQLLWTLPLGSGARYGVAVLGGRAYAVDMDRSLHAVRIEDGKELWKLTITEATQADPVALGQMLFLPVRDGILAVDLKNRKQAGRIEARAIATGLAYEKGMLCYGTRFGIVVRLEADTRRELGRTSVADEPITTALTMAHGTIFGLAETRLFAVHARTGARLWVYDRAEHFTPIRTGGDALYVGAERVFYCLR